ncbi:MAG: hypothetical protein IKY52_09275 [Clostridia bacterium]|nr:hypothetical protein [Clostridia bacterium]
MNRESTLAYKAWADSLIGNILPTHMVMYSLSGSITNPPVHLMGMERYWKP